MNDILYNRCQEIGFTPKTICEVGVYKPETSNVLRFIEDGVRTTLVEADPICINLIERRFEDYSNIELVPYAVYESEGTIKLYRCEASTFVSTLKSTPALVNDKYIPNDKDSFVVNSLTFDKIDKGMFDLISVDTEGCEWYVLKYMISRPYIISLETHGRKYVNPYLAEIRDWLKQNGYRIWYCDKSDTVYIRNEKGINLFTKLKYYFRDLFKSGN